MATKKLGIDENGNINITIWSVRGVVFGDMVTLFTGSFYSCRERAIKDMNESRGGEVGIYNPKYGYIPAFRLLQDRRVENLMSGAGKREQEKK